jgi:hypothetical protein
MRELMQEIIAAEEELEPFGTTLDVLNALGLGRSTAYEAVDKEYDKRWCKLEDRREELVKKLKERARDQ